MNVRTFRFLLAVALISGAGALMASTTADAAPRARSAARTGVNHPPPHAGGGNVNRGGNAGHNVNRNTNVNHNTNVNRNVNVNRDVNVHRDIDVDVDNNWHGGWYDHPVATAAAVTATTMVTAAVVGSIVNSVPPSCVTTVVNGVAYQQCGNTWYQPQYAGTSVQYVVIEAPR